MSATLAPARGAPAGPPGIVLRTRAVSTRIRPRAVGVSVALAVATVVVGCWSLAVGDFPVAVGDVVRALLGGGTEDTAFVVVSLRLPRIVCGILVGASFGVAGAIFQSLARNPLGSPDVIGFDTGAAVGAILMIVALRSVSGLGVATGAIAGGLLTALVVYLCAWKRGIQAYRLVLVGLGVGFTVGAFGEYLLTRATLIELQQATLWLTGSLNGRGWAQAGPAAVGTVALIPLALALASPMRLLELGDDAAAGLGIRIARTRLWLVLVGIGLASLATATAGPIAFVALMSPPIARRLVGAPGVTIVPAALCGALLVTAADLVARRALAPTELPVGLATAIVGAPYLLWLLTREIRTGQL